MSRTAEQLAPSLFDWKPPYPAKPGYKEPTTSKDAAEAIEPRVAGLRAMALGVITKRPSTPDEVATALGMSVLSIRPRITELKELDLIEKTGEHRANASGQKANVWRAK